MAVPLGILGLKLLEEARGDKIQVNNPWIVLLGRPRAQLGHSTTFCLSPIVNVFQEQAFLLVWHDFPLLVMPTCLDLTSLVPYPLTLLPYSTLNSCVTLGKFLKPLCLGFFFPSAK